MASVGDTTRPAFAYDQATDTWIPVGIGPHSHTASGVGAVATSSFAAKGDLLVGTGAGTLVAQTVGANGTVLTADSAEADGVKWAAVSAGGMTLLSTTALSGASVSVTSISGAYTDLLIVISRESTNGDAPLTGTFNSNTGTLYQFNNTIAASIPFSRGLSIDQIGSAGNNFVIRVSRYASATEFKPVSITAGFVNSATGAQVTYADGGSFWSNTAITSFQLATSGGGITFDGGNIYIYGVS